MSGSPVRALRLIAVSAAGYASYPLALGSTVTIGRGHGVEIAIDDPSVSRRHARLAIGPRGTLAITDLASANGTTVRGQLLDANRRTPLHVGEAATLGQAIVLVQEDPTSRPAPTLLPRDELRARLDERCRDAGETNLPFRVAIVAAHDDLTDEELVATTGELLGRADLVGAASEREWAFVIDDVPAGRADIVVRRIGDALAAEGRMVSTGVALWPREGRTTAALLAAATEAAARSAERPTVFLGPRMLRLLETVDQIARSPLSVLVVGETGVGKDMIAQRLHEQSPRAHRPFLKLDCATMSETLLESELFGHVRGAFTGADRDKPGLLVTADGGTAFLDEIGELSLAMQAKLLRVLEDREVRPIGALEARRIDVRFIAATHRRLDDPATFRADLFYRMSGAVIEVPPLRERVDEIAPLARLFLRAFADRHGMPLHELSPGALRVLETYAWPGNVRELKNAIERAAITCTGSTIEPHHFPVADMRGAARPARGTAALEGPTNVSGTRVPDRRAILAALARHGGNQGLAAEELRVHRRTLMRWMDLLKIPRPRKR